MSLIKALAHVCLKTTDLEKTLEFYCGALGMEKLFDFTRQEKVIGCYIRASPSTFIEVFLQVETLPSGHLKALDHFCLETDHIEKVRERLLNQGYSPGDIKMGADHSWQFWIKDPGGVDVEFHQYTEQSAQLTGHGVEVNG